VGSYSIKDLERISGIKAHTLRIWEQRYEILKPERTDTNIRTYSDNDLKRILNIGILNNNGVKISKLAKMNAEQLFQQVRDVSENIENTQNQVDNLVIAMVEMDEDRFERYMASCILRHGFDQTMSQIIYPFLQKVGLLWQTDSINPAQEHFISNLIRQKLIVAIDATSNQQNEEGKRFLLYLPENEMHEISLLYANYKIRAAGNKSIYLGQSVPYSDLKMVYNLHKPDYILTILTCQLLNSTLQEYTDRLAAHFPESQILISGAFALNQPFEAAKNILIYNDIEHLGRILSAHP
jgi:MerR family transcriptional regulator, light-induced transcriptional regulator